MGAPIGFSRIFAQLPELRLRERAREEAAQERALARSEQQAQFERTQGFREEQAEELQDFRELQARRQQEQLQQQQQLRLAELTSQGMIRPADPVQSLIQSTMPGFEVTSPATGQTERFEGKPQTDVLSVGGRSFEIVPFQERAIEQAKARAAAQGVESEAQFLSVLGRVQEFGEVIAQEEGPEAGRLATQALLSNPATFGLGRQPQSLEGLIASGIAAGTFDPTQRREQALEAGRSLAAARGFGRLPAGPNRLESAATIRTLATEMFPEGPLNRQRISAATRRAMQQGGLTREEALMGQGELLRQAQREGPQDLGDVLGQEMATQAQLNQALRAVRQRLNIPLDRDLTADEAQRVKARLRDSLLLTPEIEERIDAQTARQQ